MNEALLVTKHQKRALIAPALADLGWTLRSVEVDTDVLGTFSGDIARTTGPLETARRKALLGRDLGQEPWLLASEGTIAPSTLGIPLNLELVVAVDRASLTTITGHASRFAGVAHRFVVDHRTPTEEILRHCTEADLPHHRLLVSAEDRSFPAVGGLASADEVLEVLSRFRRRGRKLVIQTDFRAHLCPSRQAVIAAAAEDLARRLRHRCPRCAGVGFGCEEVIAGRACASCQWPTDEAALERWRCPWCSFTEEHRIVELADPRHCGRCNP